MFAKVIHYDYFNVRRKTKRQTANGKSVITAETQNTLEYRTLNHGVRSQNIIVHNYLIKSWPLIEAPRYWYNLKMPKRTEVLKQYQRV